MNVRTLALTLGAAAVVAAPAGAQSLTGAGATFPNPIYTKWFDAYNKATKVQINYQSIGSGGGIRQFTEGTVDFGATDGPMSVAQMEAVQNNVLHIPTVIGAVVLTYNLPSLGATQLQLDGATVADIYLGRITKWNDKRIAATNPGVSLPNVDIIVVPSAFTATTGRAHFETLIRARAIENLAYVIAPAQGGYHLSGRETHGDSMIIDPWGAVVARLSEGVGVVTADLDVGRVDSVRKSLPALQHRRLTKR